MYIKPLKKLLTFAIAIASCYAFAQDALSLSPDDCKNVGLNSSIVVQVRDSGASPEAAPRC